MVSSGESREYAPCLPCFQMLLRILGFGSHHPHFCFHNHIIFSSTAAQSPSAPLLQGHLYQPVIASAHNQKNLKYLISSAQMSQISLSESSMVETLVINSWAKFLSFCRPVKLDNKLFGPQVEGWVRHRVTIIDIPFQGENGRREKSLVPNNFKMHLRKLT